MNINKIIAEYKDAMPKDIVYGSGNFKKTFTTEMPDYTKDPKLILELELELSAAGWIFHKEDDLYCWSRDDGKFVNIDVSSIKDKDFGLATCLAYIEEFVK